MENCPKCGALNVKDAEFCSLCHQPFNPVAINSEGNDELIPTEEPASNKENENTIDLKPHSMPGFGIMVNEEKTIETSSLQKEKSSKNKPVKEREKPSSKKAAVDIPIIRIEEDTQEIVKERLAKHITEWLFPAIIATAMAFLTTLIVPKEQITASLGIGRILLSAAMFGLIVSSGGIAQRNLKNTITGWLLGLSSNFMAFNIIFFGSFLFMKININFYTKYFLGSEIIIVAATLSTAISFSIWLEIFESKKALSLAFLAFIVNLAISWLLLTFKLPIIPIVVFISWPASYYAAKLFESKHLPQ